MLHLRSPVHVVPPLNCRLVLQCLSDHAGKRCRNVDPSKMAAPAFPQHQDCHELWSKNRRKKHQQHGSNENNVSLFFYFTPTKCCPSSALGTYILRGRLSKGWVGKLVAPPLATGALRVRIQTALKNHK
jgi:hypothetical protein